MPTLKAPVFVEVNPIPFDGKENTIDYVLMRNLKNSTMNILNDLRSFHSKKKRQIENCFQKLVDNTSYDILNAPINQCIEDYLKFLSQNQDLIVDQTLNNPEQETMIGHDCKPIDDNLTSLEDDNELHQYKENLTSTVKKVNTGKADKLKLKIESAICEQSMIPSVDDTPVKKPQDSYGVRLTYFLKDFTQISIKLTDLSAVELKNVHKESAEDLKLIQKALTNKK